MELEFDKEIDAILRKTPRAAVAPSSAHIDADAIVAFAENALPQKAKLLYMEHLADCDRCRGVLAFASSSAEREGTAPTAIVAPAVASIPWYSQLFRRPNFALVMGALVVAFGGMLGYIALQNSVGEQNATITQITEPELRQQQGGPFAEEQQAESFADSNMAANSNSNRSASVAANTNASIVPQSNAASMSNMNSAANVALPRTMLAAPVDSTVAQATESKSAGNPHAGAQPPSIMLDGVPTTDMAKPSDADNKTKDRQESEQNAQQKMAESRRDAPSPADKMGRPTRSGPLQQNQQNQMNQMSVTRVAGGKTFANRNGAWYDSAYRNQPTTNYRRGTAEFNKLDKGLRDIANTIGGTVVLIWKAKAYRID